MAPPFSPRRYLQVPIPIQLDPRYLTVTGNAIINPDQQTATEELLKPEFDVFSLQPWTSAFGKAIRSRRYEPVESAIVQLRKRDPLDKKYLDSVVQVTRQYLLQRYLDTPSFGYAFANPRYAQITLHILYLRQTEITRVIRSGHWSQVFVGRLSNTPSESLICLKLFDDRYFPMPIPLTLQANSRPEIQLFTLHTASDMILNKESIYHRCSHFQCLLLPHCYGFHEFILPDGWHYYGLLMELIPGATLDSLGLAKFARDRQRAFITRARHALKALKLAGMVREDNHSEQILCPPGRTAADIPGVVFIDFAFDDALLGNNNGTHATNHWDQIRSNPQVCVGFALDSHKSSGCLLRNLKNRLVTTMYIPKDRYVK